MGMSCILGQPQTRCVVEGHLHCPRPSCLRLSSARFTGVWSHILNLFPFIVNFIVNYKYTFSDFVQFD